MAFISSIISFLFITYLTFQLCQACGLTLVAPGSQSRFPGPACERSSTPRPACFILITQVTGLLSVRDRCLTPDPTGNDFPPVHWLLDQGSRAQVCVGEDFHCIQTCPNTIPSTRDHDLCYRVYFLTPSAFDLFADHRILSGVAPARVMTLPTSELKGLFTSPNSI